ncbi:hypothetical protein [Haloarchaeobius sp. HME9146]|uniref:hypothetical protein n=1 Tax=Haloarchaeobius sp. HME9146 TaxID=2978732 RepID=UPI0021C170EE|nr:hypothetical protein [Haloarchaeobius sp. HME9146]MCT9095179.1 hypothetical protein [Haloarchaeobius sp. HME9146]
MKRRALLGALSGVAAAGCLRLSSGDETTTGTQAVQTDTKTDTATATATAPETQTTTGRVGELEYPSGLSDDGIGRFLYSFHTQALASASFQTKWSKIDVERSHIKWQKSHRVDDRAALGSWTRTDGGAPFEIFRSGTDALWREDMGDHYTYGNDSEGYSVEEITWGQELEPLLRAGDWNEPTLVEEEYPAVWEVETDTVEDESAIPGYHQGTIQTLSATVEIDENAVVRSVEATYQIQERDGNEIRYASQFTLDSLGEVTVTEPSWLPTARERVPKVAATLSDDDRYVKMVIESGVRLEPGSYVQLFGEEDGGHWPLEEPIEPGVETYLYKSSDWADNHHLGVTRGSKPTGVSPAPFDGSLELAARRKTNTVFSDVSVR